MKPTNEKSLFHFLCGAMDKVMTGELDYLKAQSVCQLSKEAAKLLEGERRRVDTLIKIDKHEREFGKRIEMRELAAFGFSDTTHYENGNIHYDPSENA